MGASGHIAGVINPPAARTSAATGCARTASFRNVQDWLGGATEQPGSWWTDWSAWLASHAGKQVAAPKAYGKAGKYKAIEPAPGRYVKAKAA
jgi:polyhydroxyalkanoate synthase